METFDAGNQLKTGADNVRKQTFDTVYSVQCVLYDMFMKQSAYDHESFHEA